eukprot:CAMPEP_0168503416 /NCGR_PEP_ID=MMETSP0228-20121227/75848_1 /TAXON_ID=133427 /ORGANISM="Protoceratium reticulatum, Strain CCCM 535 (=CCMP 1889)" /LENGTH=385 /DNA_ID=CAMNT_0008520479 /DNA_START=8 /DNA_END=1161 /DNA_ORIENTATION=-
MALCVFIAGVLQLLAAAFRLPRFMTLIPHAVTVGFANGIAIITVCTQMRHYHYNGDGTYVQGHFWSVSVTACVAIVLACTWSRLPAPLSRFPAPLAAVILSFVFSRICEPVWARRTLEHVAGSWALSPAGGLDVHAPAWDFPPAGVNWVSQNMWIKVAITALRFAVAGLLESLMTQSLLDQIIADGSSMRRECLGQGAGNVLASLLGLQGGGAVLIPSIINVGSGGASPQPPGPGPAARAGAHRGAHRPLRAGRAEHLLVGLRGVPDVPQVLRLLRDHRGDRRHRLQGPDLGRRRGHGHHGPAFRVAGLHGGARGVRGGLVKPAHLLPARAALLRLGGQLQAGHRPEPDRGRPSRARLHEEQDPRHLGPRRHRDHARGAPRRGQA